MEGLPRRAQEMEKHTISQSWKRNKKSSAALP